MCLQPIIRKSFLEDNYKGGESYYIEGKKSFVFVEKRLHTLQFYAFRQLPLFRVLIVLLYLI